MSHTARPVEDREAPAHAPLSASAVLTHHWLVRRRGGERVLEALGELIPDAPLYTLVHDPGSYGPFPGRNGAARPVHSSWLRRLPGARRNYQRWLPLMPWAARAMNLPNVELVLCSDAALAKAMRAHPRSRVVCYCHSPMRYVWEPEISAEYARRLPAPLRPLWPMLCSYLRRCDAAAAKRVDLFIANSQHVARRIRRCYGRESAVVYPFADLPPHPSAGPREDFYLCVGHHVPYKRLDLALAACARLGRKLVVIGDGPEVAGAAATRTAPGASRAGHGGALDHVRFLGYQPDEVVRDQYRRARGLLFPGEEDFGIVPVEAMAHGCPVIAYGRGGAVETVVDGVTGVLFAEQTCAGLAEAMQRSERMEYDAARMHSHAAHFNRARFLREVRAAVAAAGCTPGLPATV